MPTTAYTDPTSNGPTVDWDYFSYTNIDDGVRQPTTPTVSPVTSQTVYHGDGSPSESSMWDFIIGTSTDVITEVTLWFYVSSTYDALASFELGIGGDLGTEDSGNGSSGGWRYRTWTGLSISMSGGLTPRVTGTFPSISKGDDSHRYAAMYLEYTHEGSGGGGGGGGGITNLPLLGVG